MDDVRVPDVQPWLHGDVIAVAAPCVVVSGPDGDLDVSTSPAHGVYHRDVRVLSKAVLTVSGRRPDPVIGRAWGGGQALFVVVPRWLGDPFPDPTVRLDRRRTVTPHGLVERIEVRSDAVAVVRLRVELELAADLAPIEDVKSGRVASSAPGSPAPASPGPGPVGSSPGELVLGDPRIAVLVRGEGARSDPDRGRLAWDVEVAPGQRRILVWTVAVDERRVAPPHAAAVVLAAASEGLDTWSTPTVTADDHRLGPLVRAGLADLAGLRMTTTDAPEDVFLAAGAPWFFTLFGRDSLWAARLLLPLGTDLAAGTLRVLARRQGRDTVALTEEAPGKILHEVRRGRFDVGPDLHLPRLYYGTVDATPLWVCLLHDAWRWGMPEQEVAALLPTALGALRWAEAVADADRHGFVSYLETSGRGLANQGWKDSRDAVRFRDSRHAEGPVALAEVQGYAHEAARSGAALFDHFGMTGAEQWRDWAAKLADRFHRAFWVEDDAGAYPALAVDARGAPVDSLTSNAGHLLGTGILDDAESALVAQRMVAADMADGYGLRTMSSAMAAFAPLSYHCGSIWPHDTAVVVAGLARSGHQDQLAVLVDGLLAAGAEFGYRQPELWGGDPRSEVPVPLPYPAACRPQAWSAASVMALVSAMLGLDPDVPAGTLGVRPARPSPVGALDVAGLRLGGSPLELAVDSAGVLRDVRLPDGIRLRGR